MQSEKTTQVSDEVMAFAREQGVDAHVPVLVRLAREVFQCEPRLVVEDDWELEGLRDIAVYVQIGNMTTDEAFQANNTYKRSMIASMPSHATYSFRLVVE